MSNSKQPKGNELLPPDGWLGGWADRAWGGGELWALPGRLVDGPAHCCLAAWSRLCCAAATSLAAPALPGHPGGPPLGDTPTPLSPFFSFRLLSLAGCVCFLLRHFFFFDSLVVAAFLAPAGPCLAFPPGARPHWPAEPAAARLRRAPLMPSPRPPPLAGLLGG